MGRYRKKYKAVLVTAIILASAFLLGGCSDDAKQAMKPTDKFFVNDFADVLSKDVEDKIYAQGAALQEKAEGAQAVVVTIDTLDGEVISDYALELGREWGIGSKEKDNGILILLAVEDREVDIEVGYGLEGAIPDSKAGRLLDTYALPYFADDDFSSGIAALYEAVANEIYIEYGLEPSEGYIPIEQLPQQQEGEGAEVPIIYWIIMVVFIALYIGFFRRRGLFIFFGGGGHHGGGFGGGFGGGSGGFGGFSGGGGSFGGGGASRRF